MHVNSQLLSFILNSDRNLNSKQIYSTNCRVPQPKFLSAESQFFYKEPSNRNVYFCPNPKCSLLIYLKFFVQNVDHKMKLRSKRGMLPFVELNGEEIADSNNIIEVLVSHLQCTKLRVMQCFLRDNLICLKILYSLSCRFIPLSYRY
jgi:hypothetical protein